MGQVLGSGGVLVYAVCSLIEAEGEGVARALLALQASTQPGGGGHSSLLSPLPLHAAELPGFEGAITPEGWLRVLPGCLPGEMAACDGFFVARFLRN